ncbi:MAG TPA: hypothetical protein DCY88_04655 [Cyanobacteria bacterium UBA11372]|nr:hypothetical protein [Cyanobacteria bacterium UBA11372]
MKQNESRNPLELLEKLLDHPHGFELAKMVDRLYNDVDIQPHRQLVAKALTQAESLGMDKRQIPHFMSMTSDEIRMWMTQNS